MTQKTRETIHAVMVFVGVFAYILSAVQSEATLSREHGAMAAGFLSERRGE